MSAELAVPLPAEVADLDETARAELITHALVESKSWLAVATQGTDPTPIAEFKAWAATVAEMTKQKNLANEIQLDALEMVRRAERGIGVAIRNGQEAGDIETLAEARVRASRSRSGRQQTVDNGVLKPKASDFAKPDDLYQSSGGIYDLTDDVTDEQFDKALEDARKEDNLSRANVVRKVKNKQPKPSDRPEVLRKTRRLDPNRVIRETVTALEGACLGVALLEAHHYDQLDPAESQQWAESLSSSLRLLGRLRKELERVQC